MPSTALDFKAMAMYKTSKFPDFIIYILLEENTQ